ncbi:MAG: nucleotidyl transferase AbiEii/AbiGii toxin family protein [Phycisphaerae bacterium]
MKPFVTCWEVLPPDQKRWWPLLRSAGVMGFVLYGGTAVALRLGHRQSIDFDLFTERKLDKAELQTAFPFVDKSTTLQETENSWSLLVSESRPDERPVRISFCGGITNGRVGEPECTDDGNMLVASLADLMAFKVKVILQRVEAKDYRDIAAMLRAGAHLDHALSAARTLFGMTFQPMKSMKALTCFEGGDLSTLSREDRETILAAARSRIRLEPIGLMAHRLNL